MKYKFNEDETLNMINDYIKSTYSQHYAKDKSIKQQI